MLDFLIKALNTMLVGLQVRYSTVNRVYGEDFISNKED